MSELGQKNDAIRKELKKYSYKIIDEFVEIFPCTGSTTYTLDVYPKEACGASASGMDEYYYLTYLDLESPEDFWQKWNRFKKLKVFI